MRARQPYLIPFLAACLAVVASSAWSAPRVLDTLRLSQGETLEHPLPIAVNPADGMVFVGEYSLDNSKIKKVDPVTRRVVGQAAGYHYLSEAQFHDGKLYVAGYHGNWDAVIAMLDPATMNETSHVMSSNWWINSFDVDVAGRKAYYGTWGKFHVADLDTGAQEIFHSFGEYSEWNWSVSKVVLDLPRRRVYLVVFQRNTREAEYVCFDLDSRAILGRLSLGISIADDNRYDAELDGDRFFITDQYNNALNVVNVGNHTLEAAITDISWPQRMTLDLPRHRLYVLDNYTDKVHVVDTQTKSLVKTIIPGDDPSGACVDAARERIYVANVWTQDISVIHRQQETLLDSLTFLPASPMHIDLHPEQGLAWVSNGPNNGYYVLDLNQDRVLNKIQFYNFQELGGLFSIPVGIPNVHTGESRVTTASNGHRVAYAVDDFSHTLAMLDLTDSRVLGHVASNGAPTSVAMYNGKAWYPYVSNGTLYLSSTDGGAATSVALNASAQSQGIAVHAALHKAYIADYANDQVVVYDLQAGMVLRRVAVGRYPAMIAVDETNNRVLVSNYGGDSATVLNASNDSVLGTLAVGRAPWGVSVNPNNGRGYVVNTLDRTLTVLNTVSPEIVATLPVEGGALHCAVNPNSGKIYVANQSSGTITVVEDLIDNRPPVIQCPAPIALISDDPQGMIVTFTLPAAADDMDPNPVVTAIPASGSRFPVGVTPVTVTATDASGNRATCSFNVTVRMRECPRPVGDLAAQAMPQRVIELSWSPSHTANVTAYSIFMGAPDLDYASPAAVVSSSTLHWTASNLTSGVTYRFAVRAKNNECEEKNTNVVSATAYSAPPCQTAAIKSPKNGKKVSGQRVTITADTACEKSRDVAAVRFDYKPASSGDGAWRLVPAANGEHPNPDQSSPYFVHWNVSELSEGEYHLRAVALDAAGNPDPAPSFITVRVDRNDPDSEEKDKGNGTVEKVEKIENQRANTVVLANNQHTSPAQVQIPAGALNKSETKVTVKLNPDFVPAPKLNENLKPAGTHIEIELHSGQSKLGEDATLTLPYADADNNGIVDGTDIRVENLQVCYYNPVTGKWETMAGSKVDKDKKTVSAKTSHFSLFGLFSGGAVDGTFRMGDLFAYPNPAGSGQHPVIRVETGLADRLDLRIYDFSGAQIHSALLVGPPPILGGVYAFEYKWDTSGVSSGIYIVVAAASQNGTTIKKKTRIAVVK